MKTAIIIPARYGSVRFPGKPLHPVGKYSLLERVWRIATCVSKDTWIATDDDRIATHAAAFGARVLMTSLHCNNGSERAAEAMQQLPDMESCINLQGDAVLTPPWVLEAMMTALKQFPEPIVTPATLLDRNGWKALTDSKKTTPASGTLVTCRQDGTALYFSKQIIPFVRKPDTEPFPPVYRHIGLYGYRRSALETLVRLPATPLEEAEGLEQLRALEHGMTIRVVPVDYRGRTHASIDSPEDVARVEAIIEREGELV
jgi:3-deoxy-manno-octulosonate cytidylyltransferase (CMP-KDO synthetase)